MSKSLQELQLTVEALLRQMQDLSRRQQEREAECERARQAFELAPPGLLVTDLDGQVRETNRTAQGLLAGAGAGRRLDQLLDPEERLACQAVRADLRRGPLARRPRPIGLTVQGETRLWLEPAAEAVCDPDGRPEAVVWLIREEEPAPPEPVADIAPLLSRLSHESRNILQRAQAALERLGWRAQDRPETLELLARVEQAHKDLSLLFEAARDLASPLALDRQAHDLAEIWRAAWAQLVADRPRARSALTEGPDSTDLRCEVDRSRLTLAFRNVLQSALAACPDPPHLTIGAAAVELGGRPAVRIALSDNGPALSPEQQQRLFDPFAAPPVRRHALGLALARKIFEAHGGQVGAGPAPGAGVEVLVTLPRSKP
jgi:signal transduction histidine kinase